jgi:hypothetical protein
LGITMPQEIAHITSTNWGLGPAGHAAYEGGIFAMLLYAVLTALGIYWLDDPLRSQPENPFLISLHAAALPHVAGFARGDFGIMTIETVECFLFTVVLAFVCRMLLGTERSIAAGHQRARAQAVAYSNPGQARRRQWPNR